MYNASVRTTIEIKPEHRARLLEIAARRGEKGFSAVIAEALEFYFTEGEGRQRTLLTQALRQRGSLGKAEAARLRRETQALRKSWR